MASLGVASNVEGNYMLTLEIQGVVYKSVKFFNAKNLCADVIIGLDVLSNYKTLEVSFGGPNKTLKICCRLPPARLCANVDADCHPIAIKSYRHSNESLEFIEFQETSYRRYIRRKQFRLERSSLVTKNSNHKKIMVINYAQTINKFTELDAYPVFNIEELIFRVSRYFVFSTIDLRRV